MCNRSTGAGLDWTDRILAGGAITEAAGTEQTMHLAPARPSR
jgi:hypothetical protein